MEKILQMLIEVATSTGIKLVIGLIVLAVGLKLSSVIAKLIKKAKGDATALSFLSSFANIALKALVVMLVISIMGVPMSSIIAVIGSVGLAIGLAVQGSLSNVAGGIVLLLFKPFRVGDFIDTDEGAGTVEDITLYHTVLKTVDNQRLVIPNGLLSNQRVKDASYYPTRRVDLSFTVPFDSDVNKINGILLERGKNHPLALKNPEPAALLTGKNERGLEFALRVWCNTPDYWTVWGDLLVSVNEAFKENEIKTPINKVEVIKEK